MINLYDIAYGLAVAISSPYWLVKGSARKKVLDAFSLRMGRVTSRRASQPAVMIHAVSLGEINATASLVESLRHKRPEMHIIISTTTQTGYDRACQLYGSCPQISLIRYPLDFSWAVVRVLDAIRPNLVVLMELEVWPNFMHLCDRRKIPVILANGRLTLAAFRRYCLVRPIVRRMFRSLRCVCAQDQTYAQRFAQLGVPIDRIVIAGTMKFDTAQITDRIAGDQELAEATGLQPGRQPVWVCGSTGPGEEQIILQVYRQLLGHFPQLRLVIVPRKPERFDQVADLILAAGFKLLRRSTGRGAADPTAVVLGDTMGELRKFYSLADVVFVGRSLVDLGPSQHGSDMIEPAALGKPIIVGPYTGNFDYAMRKLKAADAVIEVVNAESLCQALRALLDSPQEAAAMGRRAQQVVRQNQGATQKHLQIILSLC